MLGTSDSPGAGISFPPEGSWVARQAANGLVQSCYGHESYHHTGCLEAALHQLPSPPNRGLSLPRVCLMIPCMLLEVMYLHVIHQKCRFDREKRWEAGRELLSSLEFYCFDKTRNSSSTLTNHPQLSVNLAGLARTQPHRTGTRAGPRCHTPLSAPPTANGSRTPFSSRHPPSGRSPFSSRCMCLGNWNRHSRTPRHVADGKRFVYFIFFIVFAFP